jgi:hypothetical protein
MNKTFAKIREEIEALLPPTLFFFVALHLVTLVRALMLEGTGLALGTSVSVTVAALILGKAVVIADLLPVINRYPDRPLIYNIVWKTVIYELIAMLVHYLERLVELWRATGGLMAGNEKLLAELVWPHFWAIHIFMTILILMYCTMREFVRVLGADKVRRMVFGPLPNTSVSKPAQG